MKNSFLIFERDIHTYHISLIEEGIRKYTQRGESHSSYLHFGLNELEEMDWDSKKEPVGVIGWFSTEAARDYVTKRNLPYINLYETAHRPNANPGVSFQGEGTIAAEFFVEELQYDSLGFIGVTPVPSAQRRLAEFKRQAGIYGLDVKVCLQPTSNKSSVVFFQRDSDHSNRIRKELEIFLRELPKPAGIFCANDRLALKVCYHAQRLGFSVPKEVSFLGVGNLHRADEGGVDTISVIQLDHVKQGYLAAKAMDHFLATGESQEPIRLKPDGIIHRSTTTRRLVKDTLVRRAVELMQKTPDTTISALCEELEISRRTLEIRFKNAINMTLAEALDFERFNKAKLLMKSHNYNHESIAGLAGYSNRKQMLRSFYRFAHMSPKQFFVGQSIRGAKD